MSENPGTPGASTARQKAQQMRDAEAKSKQRRNVVVASVAVVAVLAFVVGLAFAWRALQPEKPETAAGGKPKNVSAEGAVLWGSASAPVKADVYVDYMCPACKAFENANDSLFEKYVDSGDLLVRYYPVAILDRMSRGSQFSTRAATAAYCVANEDATKVRAFSKAMFEKQPEEQTKGLRNEEIAEIASSAGVSSNVEDCVDAKTFFDYVEEKTSDAGIGSTPTLKLNGEEVKDKRPESVEAKIKELLDGDSGGDKTPSATESSSDATPSATESS